MTAPAEPAQEPQSVDPRFIMRTAWLFTAAALVAAALFGVFVSPGGGLVIGYGAAAYFFLSSYTAYRCGASNYRLNPSLSAYGFLAALMLMVVAAATTIFG
jgi:hypothetical protein